MSKKIFICIDHIDSGVWWLSDEAPSVEDLEDHVYPESSIIEIDVGALTFKTINIED